MLGLASGVAIFLVLVLAAGFGGCIFGWGWKISSFSSASGAGLVVDASVIFSGSSRGAFLEQVEPPVFFTFLLLERDWAGFLACLPPFPWHAIFLAVFLLFFRSTTDFLWGLLFLALAFLGFASNSPLLSFEPGPSSLPSTSLALTFESTLSLASGSPVLSFEPEALPFPFRSTFCLFLSCKPPSTSFEAGALRFALRPRAGCFSSFSAAFLRLVLSELLGFWVFSPLLPLPLPFPLLLASARIPSWCRRV